jgi:type II secretory pathway component PulF
VIDALDRGNAVRELMRRGEVPSTLEEVGDQGAGPTPGAEIGLNGSRGSGTRNGQGSGGFTIGSVMSLSEMTSFMRELSTALRAGLPLVQGLKTIARQGRKDAQKAMLSRIIDQVEHGRSLSDAFQAQGQPFSELTVSLTRAGEASGRLGEVIGHAADLLDKDLKLRRSLLTATLYPMIIAVLVLVAVVVVTTVIVPELLKNMNAQALELPWPTRVVRGFAMFFANYWYVALGAAGAVIVAATSWHRTREGRMATDRALLAAPLVGPLMRDVAVARFTRTLATLTASGIPVVTALKVTKGTLGNRAMEEVIDRVVDQVSAGKTIAQPMEESGYFPPMLVQIVNMGERSGKLEELLEQAANAFEDKTEQSVKVFTALLPPVLLMFLAGIVGFVVMAILLALLEVQDSVMRGA